MKPYEISITEKPICTNHSNQKVVRKKNLDVFTIFQNFSRHIHVLIRSKVFIWSTSIVMFKQKIIFFY